MTIVLTNVRCSNCGVMNATVKIDGVFKCAPCVNAERERDQT